MEQETKKWTKALKKKARQELLFISNIYEPKKLKYLKKVIFYPNGRASRSGKAHDYSFWAW